MQSTARSFLRGYATVIKAASEAEKAIASKLTSGLKGVTLVEVQDTSGGCGAMYRIGLVAEEFK